MQEDVGYNMPAATGKLFFPAPQCQERRFWAQLLSQLYGRVPCNWSAYHQILTVHPDWRVARLGMKLVSYSSIYHPTKCVNVDCYEKPHHRSVFRWIVAIVLAGIHVQRSC